MFVFCASSLRLTLVLCGSALLRPCQNIPRPSSPATRWPPHPPRLDASVPPTRRAWSAPTTAGLPASCVASPQRAARPGRVRDSDQAGPPPLRLAKRRASRSGQVGQQSPGRGTMAVSDLLAMPISSITPCLTFSTPRLGPAGTTYQVLRADLDAAPDVEPPGHRRQPRAGVHAAQRVVRVGGQGEHGPSPDPCWARCERGLSTAADG